MKRGFPDEREEGRPAVTGVIPKNCLCTTLRVARKFTAANIPKVVGGLPPACPQTGVALYEAAFEKVVPVISCKVAELTKLLENIYRAVNIGLVNELKIVADAMNIDIWEVIRAASTKPFGFTPFYPGPGLGGHCIPIDPFYFTWKAREFGVNTRFIELPGQINRSMPEYVVRRTMLALNDRGKAMKGSRVLFVGLAYKADVDDMRESPTFEFMDRFGRWEPKFPAMTLTSRSSAPLESTPSGKARSRSPGTDPLFLGPMR